MLKLSHDAVMKLMVNHDNVVCPYCDNHHSLSDSDTSEEVVSMWGEEEKRFTCTDCDKEFIVSERVTRQFHTSKLEHDEDVDCSAIDAQE